MKELNITARFTVYENSEELESSDKDLLFQAIAARKKAYSPYSKFSVGVSLLLGNGKIILGNNQENAAFPSGMCAERVAIWNASSQYPNIPIKKIFISASSSKSTVNKPVSPCGSCRQAIVEYEIKQAENIKIYFSGETGQVIESNSINDLLPLAFDKNLL